jgi:hypothetical protein
MLVLQNVIFWGGLAAFALWLSYRWAWAIVVAVGFWPSVLANLGTVWKDVGMGAALMASLAPLAFLRTAQGRYRAPLAILAFVFLCYGAMTRQNAIVAVVPLAALLADGLFPFAKASWKRSIGATGLLLIAILGIYVLFSQLLVSHRQYLWQQSMVFDLVAITLAENQDQFPGSYWRSQPNVSLEHMRELYDPSHSGTLFFTIKPGHHFEFIQSDGPMPQELRDLAWAWARSVAYHPIEYVEHRVRMGRILMAFATPEVCLAFHEGVDDNDLGVPHPDSPLNRTVMRFLHAVRNTFFFRGWLYIAVLLLGLGAVLSRHLPQRSVITAMIASGLLNGLPHLVIGVGCDFRFLFWTVVTALLTFAYFVIQAAATWTGRPTPTEPL